MRALIAAIPETGHLNPLLPVARQLEAAGHTVGFFSHGAIAVRVAEAGLRATVFGAGEPEPELQTARFRADDVSWLARWFKLAITRMLSPEALAAARAAVSEFRPDVMAIDPLAYASIAAAEEAGIPWAGLSPNFLALAPEDWSCPMRDAYVRIAEWHRALLASHGIRHPLVVNEVVSPWLRVVFTTDSFVGARPRGIFRVGPTLAARPRSAAHDFPWDRLARDRPILYVSSGGGQSVAVPYWSDALTKVFSSLSADEAQFVAVLHDLIDQPFGRELPPHVIGVRYAPQLELLERVSAVVTQGGANTTTESLYHARPLLVLPAVNEQSLQGLLVERAGAGFTIPASRLEVAECRERLLELLHNPALQQRAQAISTSLRAPNGALRAAELIVELATTRRPVTESSESSADA
jgi:MGT family glycosyltransferase